MKKKHRLQRLLKRDPQIREFVQNDLDWLWIAYKFGNAQELRLPENLEREHFNEHAIEAVLTNYQRGFVVEAPARGSMKPVGAVFLITVKGIAFIGDVIWTPWATSRNRLEATVAFLSELGKDNLVTEYARPKDQPFFDHIMKNYGVLRRVGTKYGIYPDSPAFEYETRRAA